MPSYRADELLAQVQEAAIRQGFDGEAVRAGFIADNSEMGRFNPNRIIDLGGTMTVQDIAKVYSKNPGNKTVPTTTVRRTSSKVSFAPGAIENVIQAGDDYQAGMAKIMDAVSGVSGNIVNQAERAGAATVNAGSSKGEAIRLEATFAQRQQENRDKLLKALGADATAEDSRVMQANTEMAKAQQALTALQPELDALRSVSFMDDPIAWVKAQFQLEGKAQEYNSAAQTFDTQSNIAATIRTGAASALALQPGEDPAVRMKRAEAEAQAMEEAATAQSFQTVLAGKNMRMAEFGLRAQILGQTFTNAAQIARLTQERNAELEQNAKTEAEKIDLRMANTARERFGLRALDALQFKALQPAEKTFWLKKGSRLTLDIADTPGQAIIDLENVEAYNEFKRDLPESVKSFYDTLVRQSYVNAKTLVPNGDPKKMAQAREDFINKKFKDWRDATKDRDYVSLSDDNPFKFNPAIAAQAEALKDNSIAQWVTTQSATNQRLTDKDVMNYALGQVRAKIPVSQVAAELSGLFSVGYASQLLAYRLQTVGMDVRNATSGRFEYPVAGYTSYMADSLSKPALELINNRASIENWLVLEAVRSRTFDKVVPMQLLGVPR